MNETKHNALEEDFSDIYTPKPLLFLIVLSFLIQLLVLWVGIWHPDWILSLHNHLFNTQWGRGWFYFGDHAAEYYDSMMYYICGTSTAFGMILISRAYTPRTMKVLMKDMEAIPNGNQIKKELAWPSSMIAVLLLFLAFSLISSLSGSGHGDGGLIPIFFIFVLPITFAMLITERSLTTRKLSKQSGIIWFLLWCFLFAAGNLKIANSLFHYLVPMAALAFIVIIRFQSQLKNN